MVDYFLGMQPSNVKFIKWNERDVKSKKSISFEDFLATKVEIFISWKSK
jgi:protein disulfide-isomerase A6